MIETIDSFLDWRSPLKAEPNYNKSSQAAYLGTPTTRPKRISEFFPFWPRPRGSLAPDLVIVEYRKDPFEIDNVFAAVEIKFPGDWVQDKQMKDYVELMTPKEGADRANIGRRRVALLRVPEDCVAMVPEKKKDQPQQEIKKPKKKGGRR